MSRRFSAVPIMASPAELFVLDVSIPASQCPVEAALDAFPASWPARVFQQEAPPCSPVESIAVHLLTWCASHLRHSLAPVVAGLSVSESRCLEHDWGRPDTFTLPALAATA